MNSSLKVQHCQSVSPDHCYKRNYTNSSQNSESSLINSNSSTLTGECTSDKNKNLPNGKLVFNDSPNSNANKNLDNKIKCLTPCKCNCSPDAYNRKTLSPDEIQKETCKIIENSSKIDKNTARNNFYQLPKSKNVDISTIKTNNILLNEDTDENTWSMMLIGLAQINPTSSFMNIDPFDAVPSISVVPPTPSDRFQYRHNVANERNCSDDDENSPEDSPQDEDPPYKVLNTTLKRYGTLSSLEKMPSDETDEKVYGSSDEELDEYEDDG